MAAVAKKKSKLECKREYNKRKREKVRFFSLLLSFNRDGFLFASSTRNKRVTFSFVLCKKNALTGCFVPLTPHPRTL